MATTHTSAGRPHVVLVGAGHGHLHAIRHAADYARRGISLTLVAPEPFRYSAMASGVLGGMYAPGANEVEVAAWVTRAGGRVLRGAGHRLDAGARLLHLEDGRVLRYDALSLNVGSVVALPGGVAAGGEVWPAKPVAALTALRGALEARFRQGAATRVVVAGGGASGCEIAANVTALARLHRAAVEVRLLHDGGRLLPESPARAGDALASRLESLGVRVCLETRLAAAPPGRVRLGDGAVLRADIVVAATGLRASPMIAESGLPVADDGALVVDARLRSPTAPRVFAVGDAAALEGRELPRVGVYAIRQARVLHRNLIACVQGRTLRSFRPQRRFLLILNLGDGTALATRGRLHWLGRGPLRLKDRIDRRFLESVRTGA